MTATMIQDLRRYLLWLLASHSHVRGGRRRLASLYKCLRVVSGFFLGVGVALMGRALWGAWQLRTRAQRTIEFHSSLEEDLDEGLTLEGETVVPGSEPGEVRGELETVRHPARFRPRRFEALASSLAWECYAQFGARERTEANVLVSRKFMRDLLDEKKGLRAKDKARLIDRALLLSFLPTAELRDIIEQSTSWVWRASELTRGSGGPTLFATLFGGGRGFLGVAGLVSAPEAVA